MGAARDRLFVVSALAGVALFACLIWPLAYGGLQTMHDMGDWYVPMRHFYAECLQHGDASDWIPEVYCGYYLQGDGQVGMYHPFHWLIYRFLSLTLAVNLEMTLSFLVMLGGVFVLLRRNGLDRGVAMFGGVAVAYGGYQFQHYEHMNALQVLAHIPWLTVCIDVAFRSPSPRRAGLAAVGVALLTTSELLIGYPQYFWFSNLWEASYALMLMASPATRPTWSRIVSLAACKGLGVAGGAVQLLPTADLLSTSLREEMSRDDRAQWPWHPFEWTTLVAPNLFRANTLATFQPGIVSVALVCWLFVRRGIGRVLREPVTLLLTILGLLTATLALGRLGLLYELHLDAPVIGVFRMPYRYLCLTNLAVGMLAAIGLRDLLRAADETTESTPRRRFLFALPVLGLVAIAGVWWLDRADRAFYVERHVGSYSLALLGVAALAVVAWLIHRIERGRHVRGGVFALVAIMVLDLGTYGCIWLYRGGAPVTLEEYVAAIPQPPDSQGFRASVAVQNQLVFTDVSMPHGYMPLLPDAPLLWEIDEKGERDEQLLRIAGVKWIQDEERGNRWTQVSGHVSALRSQKREWLEVPDPQPRARLVSRLQSVAEGDAAAAVEASKKVDVARVAVVESSLHLDPWNGEAGSVRMVADRPGRITVEVETAAPQLLVVNERAHAGWRAFVDRDPASVVRTYGTFLGCLVGPGVSTVEFRFEPDSLMRGRMISALAILCMGLAAGGVFLATRRRP